MVLGTLARLGTEGEAGEAVGCLLVLDLPRRNGLGGEEREKL